MLTLLLISTILAQPVHADWGGQGLWPAPRQGYAAVTAPKTPPRGSPDVRRALYAGKVEAAWLLAGGVPQPSEPEACP
ncbi:hypothetical protein [Brevundimonas sp.]|uniref:hypothetical protein n=1 Tax=Brevundimonas sp. TaxID=1871086 RepID=UPI0025B98327|nr:hypothetical protein [Brevundimonas sp.]